MRARRWLSIRPMDRPMKERETIIGGKEGDDYLRARRRWLFEGMKMVINPSDGLSREKKSLRINTPGEKLAELLTHNSCLLQY